MAPREPELAALHAMHRGRVHAVHRSPTHPRIVKARQHRRDPRLPVVQNGCSLPPTIRRVLRTPEVIPQRRLTNAQVPRDLSDRASQPTNSRGTVRCFCRSRAIVSSVSAESGCVEPGHDGGPPLVAP